MTWTHNFTAFYKFILLIGLPVVNFYHVMCGNIFLNTDATDANGMEWMGNKLLTPYQYLFVGQIAEPTGNPNIPYRLTHKYKYNGNWQLRTLGSIVCLPVGTIWGSVLKGISYISPETSARHQAISKSLASSIVKSKNAYYRTKGIAINNDLRIGVKAPTGGYHRREGDEAHLNQDKIALADIIVILEKNQIPHWIDCGTCLGAYRYEGVIPWDNDIDIAILRPDFDNVRRALNDLDSEKYSVQDWSSRDKPKSLLKVHLRGTDVLVDIYNYEINEKTSTFQYIVSNEDNIFMTEEWRHRERKYKTPVPYDMIFPLKRAVFDGINVAVPNKMEAYLQVRYGENLDPIMVYDPKSNSYEKDETHPYWNNF